METDGEPISAITQRAVNGWNGAGIVESQIDKTDALKESLQGLTRLDARSEKYIAISNFNARVLGVQYRYSKDGAVEILVILSLFNSQYNKKIQIQLKSLKQLPTQILDRFPMFYIRHDVSNVEKLLVDYVRQEIPKVISERIYTDAGWNRIDNRMVYVHDGLAPNPAYACETGERIAVDQIEPYSAFINALNFLQVSDKKELIIPLFLFSYAGFLAPLFQEIGHPIHFLTFLTGSTGTFKTSVSSLLCHVFEEDDPIVASFTDSESALRHKLHDYADRTIVIDDFHPAGNRTDATTLAKKLEAVTRMIGDGVGGARCIGSGKIDATCQPRSTCIITGELIQGSESSMLRYLILPVAQGNFKKDILKQYQTNPKMLTSNIYFFLNEIGTHYEGIINNLKQNYSNYFEYFAKVGLPERLCDAGAVLMDTYNVLCNYGISKNVSSTQLDFCFGPAVEVVLEALRISNHLSQQLKPAKMYLIALQDCIANKTLRIARTEAEYEQDSANFNGYYKESEIHLAPSQVFPIICKYWDLQRQAFPFTQMTINRSLAEEDLIRTSSSNGFQIRSSAEIGDEHKRPWMLAIRRDKMDCYLASTHYNKPPVTPFRFEA